MKIVIYFAATALFGFAAAGVHQHAHEILHQKRHEGVLERNAKEAPENVSCGCTTSWTTYYGEPTCISLLTCSTATRIS